MEAREVLNRAIDGSTGDVTIPRTAALQIEELLRQRDAVTLTVDTMLTPTQRLFFAHMSGKLGVVFSASALQEAAGIKTTTALYVAVWRFSKALAWHLPQYRLRSVLGEGWRMEAVEIARLGAVDWQDRTKDASVNNQEKKDENNLPTNRDVDHPPATVPPLP